MLQNIIVVIHVDHGARITSRVIIEIVILNYVHNAVNSCKYVHVKRIYRCKYIKEFKTILGCVVKNFIIKNFIITINMQLQRKEISKKRENSLAGTILIKLLYVLHLNLYDQ